MRLLLLPGMDGTGDLFRPLIEALSLPARVVSYPTDELAGYAELLELARSQLTDEPTIVVGESFSGPLAVRLGDDPRVVGVVLAASFASSPLRYGSRALGSVAPLLFRASPPRFLLRALLAGFNAPGTLIDALKATLRRLPSNVLAARLLDVLAVDVRQELRASRTPLLVLVPTRDRLVHKGLSRELAALRPDARVLNFQAPHLLLQRAPAEAAAAIEEFARELSLKT